MMESSGQRYGVRKESPSLRGKIYFLQTTFIKEFAMRYCLSLSDFLQTIL